MIYRERWDELRRQQEKMPALKLILDKVEKKYPDEVRDWLPEMLTTTDIVGRYGVSKGTVSRHRKEGKLKYVGRGRNIRHEEGDVVAWARKYRLGRVR